MKKRLILMFTIFAMGYTVAQTECRLKTKDGNEVVGLTYENDEFTISNGFTFKNNGKTNSATPDKYQEVTIGNKTFKSLSLPNGEKLFLKVEVKGKIMLYSHNYLDTRDVTVEAQIEKDNVALGEPPTTNLIASEDPAMTEDVAVESGILDAMVEEEPVTEFYVESFGKLIKINKDTFKQDLSKYFPGLYIAEDRRYYDLPDVLRNYRAN